MEGPVDLISEPGFIFMLTARTTLCVYPDGVIGVRHWIWCPGVTMCVCVCEFCSVSRCCGMDCTVLLWYKRSLFRGCLKDMLPKDSGLFFVIGSKASWLIYFLWRCLMSLSWQVWSKGVWVEHFFVSACFIVSLNIQTLRSYINLIFFCRSMWFLRLREGVREPRVSLSWSCLEERHRFSMKVPSCPLALRCGTEYIEVAMFFAPAAYRFFWFGCLFFFDIFVYF